MHSGLLDRRRFLTMGAVAAGAAIVGGRWPATAPEIFAQDTPRWSDPATWGGRVPDPGEWVSLDRPVVLDTDAQVGGLAIQIGGALVFDPRTSCTLTSTANIVVMGLLQMRPSAASIKHLIRFADVDESLFVGGGHQVLDTDVGLWCLHDGRIDIAGTPKRAWARTTSGVAAGAQSITLRMDPVGWEVGDEVAIVPTLGPEHANHHDAYDYATVTGVAGSTIQLSNATRFEHPAVEVGSGIVMTPEVLNLSRNVNIEGTSGGRAHIMFVHTGKPQQMSYFGMRWLAPRKPDGSYTRSVLGRYALHFHMVGDSSRGSNIVGGVVRDAGGHAFVAHESHGISFTSCISHNTFDDAFWWDGMVDTRTAGPDTHDVLYESCIASRVQCDPPFRGTRLAGFNMGAGSGNRAFNCTAVGIQGNRDAAGFKWPEGPTHGLWQFSNSISHNNKCNGSFAWQNTGLDHVIENFVYYYNGIAGIAHGAYQTNYQFRNGYLYRNGQSSIDIHSNSNLSKAQQFISVHCAAQPGSKHAVRVMKHNLDGGQPTKFVGCSFKGQSGAAVAMTYDGSNGATTKELFDIVDCESTSPLLWLRDDTLPESVIRIQGGGAAIAATPAGTSGTFTPEWNAMVTEIAPFSSDVGASAPISISAGSPLPGISASVAPSTTASETTTTTVPETTTTSVSATTTTTVPETTTTTTTDPEITTTTSSAELVLDKPARGSGEAARGGGKVWGPDDPKPGKKK